VRVPVLVQSVWMLSDWTELELVSVR